MEIPLKGALSLEKIRVNVPSVFTAAISDDEVRYENTNYGPEYLSLFFSTRFP